MGLATVYGIVKRAGGFIQVESAPDCATAFRIYLSRTELPAQVLVPPALATRPGGHERVLIIEDADAVRALAAAVLKRSGYDVLDVPSGEAAEQLFADDGFEVDLVLSDIVLTGMTDHSSPSACGRGGRRRACCSCPATPTTPCWRSAPST